MSKNHKIMQNDTFVENIWNFENCKSENGIIYMICNVCNNWKERINTNFELFSTSSHQTFRKTCNRCRRNPKDIQVNPKKEWIAIETKIREFKENFESTEIAKKWIEIQKTNATSYQKRRIDDQLILAKLKYYLNNNFRFPLQSDCKIENGILLMQCCICKTFKERISENFKRLSKKNSCFLTCYPGYECFVNCISNGCNECNKEALSAKLRTNEGFIQNLVIKYKLTPEWFQRKFTKQNGKGPISGMPLKIEVLGHNATSIHRIDNTLEHTETNCFLELNELNVAQHQAISCLFEAWKEVYKQLINFYQNPEIDNSLYLNFIQTQVNTTPQDIGIKGKTYSNDRMTQHIPTIIRGKLRSHIYYDKKYLDFKTPDNTTSFNRILFRNAIAKLTEQKWRCFYTGIQMTFERKYNQFSFERINNDLPHFTEQGELTNVVFICRLFNSPRQLSRQKILDYLLHQELVVVPDDVKEKAQMEYNELSKIPLVPIPPPKKRKYK